MYKQMKYVGNILMNAILAVAFMSMLLLVVQTMTIFPMGLILI